MTPGTEWCGQNNDNQDAVYFDYPSSGDASLTGERMLYWKLTGRENLEYFAALYHLQPSDTKKRISYLLQLIGLADREDTVVENYSTGMWIRLSFAKALLNEAPVLLFDEPTASLDPQTSRLLRDIIRNLKKH